MPQIRLQSVHHEISTANKSNASDIFARMEVSVSSLPTLTFSRNSRNVFGTPVCGLMSSGMCLVSENDLENSFERLEKTHLKPLGLCEHIKHRP